MGHTYPILLDLSGELVVIVGGGPVSARKARGAVAAGAIVRVIAPRFCEQMPGDVLRVCETYRAEHLTGARLAFAATDDGAVNDAVVRDAKAARIWVNRADSAEGVKRSVKGGAAGNFVVPAVFNEQGVIVAVSAGSAAVSVKIRDRLAQRFDPAWATVAETIRKLRPQVRASGLAPSRRAAILRDMTAFIDEHSDPEPAMKLDTIEATLTEWLHRRLADETR